MCWTALSIYILIIRLLVIYLQFSEQSHFNRSNVKNRQLNKCERQLKSSISSLLINDVSLFVIQCYQKGPNFLN